MKKVLLLIMAVVLMFSAITLVACSNDEEFTITFEVDGEVYDTVLVKGTAEISLPANPEKNGYVFKGWFFDKEVLSDEVTKKSFLEESLLNNITVYAKWELDKYAITYNLNGGTNSETNPASYTIEDAVTLSNPTKANNGFLGWFSDENLTTAFTGVAKGTTGSVTVYAKWAVNHFTYTFFDENGTTVLKTATVAYGSDIVAPSAPTKADANGYSYSFNSWDKTVPSTITTNITFTASYTETAIEYSVTYILDDGENNVDNVNSYTIEDENIMLFDPEKTGYIFIGWFTDADFNSPITEIAQGSLGNLDIYAKWEKFITLNADMMQIIDDIWGDFGVDLVDADHKDFYNTCQDFDTTAAVLYRALTINCVVVAIEFTPEVNRNEYLTILADSYTWINFMEDGFVFRYMPYSNIIYLDVYSIGNILSGDFVWNDSQSAYLSGDGTHLLRYLGIDEEYTVASTITSIADKAFNGCDTLVTVTIPNSVNTIGVGAFAYCFNLVSITLPEGITTIETEMFYCCFDLVSAAIPSSVTTINHSAFFNCNSLEITLVEGILYIYDYAFSYCTSIATINIPNTVVYIGEHAFSFCDNAEAAFIPNSVEYIGGYAFNNYYDLVLFVQATSKPENWDEYWTNIDDEDIFWGVNSLFEYEDMLYLVKNEGATLLAYSGNSANKVTVPSSINVNGNIINVIAIYKKAFIDNQSIKEVVISNGIVSIGDEVFAWCEKLEKVTIPNSVLTIGDGVFYSCIKLDSVNLPQNLQIIGIGLFANCKDLTSITIPDAVTAIMDSAFDSCVLLEGVVISETSSLLTIGDMAFYNCTSLTAIYIPNGVTTIGHSVFGECTSLPSIVLPDSVLSLGLGAFDNCQALTTVVLSANITAIENATFQNCSALTTIIIPNSVKSIGNYAFARCTSLESIYIPISVITLKEFAFIWCLSSVLTIYAEVAAPVEPDLRPDGWEQQYNPNGCTVVWSSVMPQ